MIDEEVLLREGLCGILASDICLSVVGATGDMSEALDLAAEGKPHVILLGIRDADGAVETAHRLQQAAPQSVVVVLGAHATFDLVQGLLGVGVRGYLLKTASSQELIATVRACRDGSRRIFLALPPEALILPEGRRGEGQLTKREREVLDLTARALSNAQIAASLGLSEPTAKRHLRNIFSKLGAVSRIDAVNKALAASLIPGRSVAG